MNLKKVMAIGACVVACSGSAADWTAVWKATSQNSCTWNSADNWENEYVGGRSADDDINFAAPFAPLTSGCRNGQSINLVAFKPTFHSITGTTSQVIVRSGENSGTITMVDPTDFRGIWGMGGLGQPDYILNPANGSVPTMQKVQNGFSAAFTVNGGSVFVRDLLGDGCFRVAGDGELVLNTPRNIDARALVKGTATLTVKATHADEPQIAPHALWHLDASKTDSYQEIAGGDGRTYVTNWCDADGRGVAAFSKEGFYPFVSSITAGGYHLIDFGGYLNSSKTPVPADSQTAYGPAAYMKVGDAKRNVYTYNQPIREAFAVFKAHALTGKSFAGPFGNTGGYEQPLSFRKNAITDPMYARTGDNHHGTANYRLWLDGKPYMADNRNVSGLNPCTTWDPTALHVVAFHFDEGSIPYINAIGMARGYTEKECGGFALAEIVVYTNVLSDVARTETIDALKRKWLSGMEAKDVDLDAVVLEADGTAINVDAGDEVKVRTVRNSGTRTAAIVKTGEGQLDVEQVLPAGVALEVQGGGVLFTHDTPAASTARADVPQTGLLCWLDATAEGCFTANELGEVSKWTDCRADKGNTYANIEQKAATGTAVWPTAATDATSGLKMLDFGSARTENHSIGVVNVNGSGMSGVYEGFVVWKNNLTKSDNPGVVDDGGRNGGLRNDGTCLVYPGHNYSYISGGIWDVDGEPLDASAADDFYGRGVGEPIVVHFRFRSGYTYRYLANGTWSSFGKAGGCAVGEYLAYDRNLTDAERRNVTAYLLNKWKNGATYPLDADDTVSKVSFADGVAPKLGTTSDRTVGAVSGAGTLTKTGAGKLTVGVIDAAITNLDVAAGTLKTTVDWMGDAWLHLDASDLSSFEFADGASGEGAEILRWNDVRGNGLYAGSITTDTYDGFYCTKPVYRATTSTVLGGLENMPHVDFGPMATSKEPITRGAGMFFYGSGSQIKPTDIAEFHIVFTFKAGNCAALGSDSNTEAALTPRNHIYGGYWTTCTCPATAAKRSNGSVWYSDNWFTKPAGTCTDKFIVLSQVNTNGNIKAWSLGVDRNCGVGGVRVAEVLIFRGATNSTAKANAIHDYLYKKWKGKGEGTSLPVFNGVNIASGATLELANLGGGAVSLAKLSGAGTFKAEGVSGLGEIGATVAADGTVSCATLTGALTLAETGVVTVSLGNPRPAGGRHRILAAASVTNSEAIAGWTLQVTGESKCSFSISADATGVYLNVVKPGMLLIVR